MSEQELLKKMFQEYFGVASTEIKNLKGDGSDRTLYRLVGNGQTAIGVYGKNRKENEAFISFSETFFAHKINVPQIYLVDLERHVYLEEDLGDETLFTWLEKKRQEKQEFDSEIIAKYKEILAILPLIQITAGQHINYGLCYQHIEFAHESMLWDMHYFKWNFLNLFYKEEIDNERLEEDFNKLAGFLLEAEKDFFVYRDFQSRNIMLKNGTPYFIDYQSGRRGALQYDLASLLYDAKAKIPEEIRAELLDYYLSEVNKIKSVDQEKFKKYFYGFVLIRIMQALGAYGFLGLVKNKPHFLKSIPLAIENLNLIERKLSFLTNMPSLKEIIAKICQLNSWDQAMPENRDFLVRIFSFGFKKSDRPIDETENNGGFVFDCRGLVNPFWEKDLEKLTGLDEAVKNYLDAKERVQNFLNHVYELIDLSINSYQTRGYTDLMVSFGCTGGAHRSVYCAEKLASYLKEKGIKVKVQHLSLKNNL
ncbi:MAG TPA: RNase adapter RapZ [bacterium]|nr:RNase adapter RapZ [bacterium]HPL95530.1 RNase adapter RapZ [bacterium]